MYSSFHLTVWYNYTDCLILCTAISTWLFWETVSQEHYDRQVLSKLGWLQWFIMDVSNEILLIFPEKMARDFTWRRHCDSY